MRTRSRQPAIVLKPRAGLRQPRPIPIDLAGNLTHDGTIAYTYSARGWMSSATVGTAKTSYLYNGLGQRVRQVTGTLANPTGVLVYDEAGHIVGEYHSVTGKASKEFIYLGDMPVGILEQVVTGVAPNQVYGMNMYYVYVDHLNTPRVITRSPDGKMVWRWDGSDPSGLMAPNDNPAGLGVFTMNLRMPGQYFDKSTNLFYNYYRDYDPQTGRYLQSDPIGLRGSINTYGYVGGNPLKNIGPDGRFFFVPAFYYGGVSLLAVGVAYYGMAVTRPDGMNPLEERHFDCTCAKADDPCLVLKAAVMRAIGTARGKMDAMLNDKALFKHAYSVSNPTVTGANATWIGHVNDLNGRTNNIWAMITLGRKMGCDMSSETAAAMTIHTPGAPHQL